MCVFLEAGPCQTPIPTHQLTMQTMPYIAPSLSSPSTVFLNHSFATGSTWGSGSREITASPLYMKFQSLYAQAPHFILNQPFVTHLCILPVQCCVGDFDVATQAKLCRCGGARVGARECWWGLGEGIGRAHEKWEEG